MERTWPFFLSKTWIVSRYITVDKDGLITLTPEGLELANKIYERHTVLTHFLVKLGVNPEVAAEDACKLEHAISDESLQAIKAFIQQ